MATDNLALDHLGPYKIKDVNNGVLGMVQFDGAPVVVKQAMANGVADCAVLARKDVRLACVGCFKRDMRIADGTRCKMCSSFVKHWDTKDNVRRLACKINGDVAALESAHAGRAALLEASAAAAEMITTGIDAFSDEELLNAIKDRDLGECVVGNMGEEALAKAMDNRDFKSLIDARAPRLIHELRRQKANISCDDYFGDKKEGLPHHADAVGAVLDVIHEHVAVRKSSRKHGKVSNAEEPTKKQKVNAVEHVSFPPKACNDLTLADEGTEEQ